MSENLDTQSRNPQQDASASTDTELSAEQLKALRNLTEPQVFMQWIAPAYRQTEKSKAWYAIMGLVVLVFVIYGMFTTDSYGWIVSITFLILAGVYYLNDLKPPPMVRVAISQLGIKFGAQYFPFNKLKSFWLLNEDDARHLNLTLSKGERTVTIIVPEEVNLAQLREYILLQIPEEEGKEESFSEQLIRNLGL